MIKEFLGTIIKYIYYFFIVAFYKEKIYFYIIFGISILVLYLFRKYKDRYYLIHSIFLFLISLIFLLSENVISYILALLLSILTILSMIISLEEANNMKLLLKLILIFLLMPIILFLILIILVYIINLGGKI